jgi:nucleotide-binding universal stress UspA family protein
VTILPVPRRDPALERAIAASVRVVGQATGTIPRIFGEPRPPEQAIPSAAAALSASLVLLGCGGTEIERMNTALVVQAIGCSVLIVPAPEPI